MEMGGALGLGQVVLALSFFPLGSTEQAAIPAENLPPAGVEETETSPPEASPSSSEGESQEASGPPSELTSAGAGTSAGALAPEPADGLDEISTDSSTPEAPLAPSILHAEKSPRDSIFDAGFGRRGQVTIAIGGLADALDPRAAAGASLRVPQFAADARIGLGDGWSVAAHLNTVLAINELNVGLSWAFPVFGQLRGVAQFQTGAFLGMLGSFGFESTVLAPEFRPLVGLSLQAGSMRWSLRGEIVVAAPSVATLGEVSDTLATPPAIANWNVALVLENLMKTDRLWYAGLVLMASTASYQNWLLFPDTSYYDYYPRIMGGYEF